MSSASGCAVLTTTSTVSLASPSLTAPSGRSAGVQAGRTAGAIKLQLSLFWPELKSRLGWLLDRRSGRELSAHTDIRSVSTHFGFKEQGAFRCAVYDFGNDMIDRWTLCGYTSWVISAGPMKRRDGNDIGCRHRKKGCANGFNVDKRSMGIADSV